MASQGKTRWIERQGVLRRVECPEPVEGQSYVYILQCEDGGFYIGQTSNVSKRMEYHQKGIGAQHTAIHHPMALVYVEGPMESALARRREVQIKKWSVAKKLALIEGDVEALRELSKSRDHEVPHSTWLKSGSRRR